MAAHVADMNREGGFFKDYSWQERAEAQFMANLPDFYNEERGNFEHAYVVEVSPSGGKSTFALKVARTMIQAGLIDKVFIVVPRETIKGGFKRDCEFVAFNDANYCLADSKNIRIDDDLRSGYNGMLRNYHGAAINYHSLDTFLGYFGLLAKTGTRMLFVFDEAHHGKTGDNGGDDCANEWGKAMAAVRQLAHAVICMTGTPVRTDQEPVPYLRYERVNQINPKTGQMSPASYVKADFKFSYKMAIEAGVARKMIFRPQDPTVAFRYGNDTDGMHEFNGPLSGVPRHLVDRAKRELFSPKRGHIDDMLKLALEENRLDRKIGDAEAAVLVVVGPTDEQTGFNPLVHVAGRIKALFGEIAIAVESKDGPQAREAVDKFRDGDARWILSKDMINEGTSIPRVRTVLILRDIKSQVRFDQTVHRATRNRSDEFSQDAKVVLFHLPDMMVFVGAIEEEIRFIVPAPSPPCPRCRKVLEFKPRRGRPCPFCAYEPSGDGATPTNMDFEWLFSEFGQESVKQGGEDFSRYDPISRVILAKFGQNPYYGGRHGMNEIFRAANEENLINLSEAKQQSPWSAEEQMDKHWDEGRKLCERTAGLISRAQGRDYQDTVRLVTAECKRVAGMGRDKQEKVKRDYPNPIETFKRFFEAAKSGFERASRRHGSAA